MKCQKQYPTKAGTTLRKAHNHVIQPLTRFLPLLGNLYFPSLISNAEKKRPNCYSLEHFRSCFLALVISLGLNKLIKIIYRFVRFLRQQYLHLPRRNQTGLVSGCRGDEAPARVTEPWRHRWWLHSPLSEPAHLTWVCQMGGEVSIRCEPPALQLLPIWPTVEAR